MENRLLCRSCLTPRNDDILGCAPACRPEFREKHYVYLLKLLCMPDKKYEWHRIADAGALALADQEIRLLSVARRKLCITAYAGQLYAFSPKCPHAGGNLAAGHVDAHGNIVCPVHRYKYCLRNGFNVSGEGFYLKTYPLEYREDGIYAGFASDSLWDFFRK